MRMIVGFIIWSSVGLIALGTGICAWKSEKAAGFYTGTEPPKVNDVRGYNRAVALLWFAYAGLFELLGLPLLFLKQNSAAFLWPVLGVVVITIGLMIGYSRILAGYSVKQKRND